MSIIIMVLYGAFVFNEGDVLRRLSGALLMVAGAVIIVLFN
jgi:drug/metabolite transporter (DMT)-like permease